jgi:hypothetical protein
LVEALACGLNVIVSDLPGIKEWFSKSINSSNRISYLDIPPRVNEDQLKDEDKTVFVKSIKEKLLNALASKDNVKVEINLDKYTWKDLTLRLYDLLK